MNFKVYSSKFIVYALNFIHFLFQFQTLCFDVRRKIFEVQRLNLWKSNSNLWNSKHCFQDWNYILWNSNFNLRHSKLFFEIQILITELQRIKFKLLNIPIIISKIRHIAITNCPFRFAFSHLPRCGQLLRQKDRKNFTWNSCASFS